MLLAALVLWILHSGCSKDHSRLAKSDDTTASGSGAAGGAGGSGGISNTGTGGNPEPDGPDKLTIVNGVVDWPAIRLCLLPYPSGATGAESPWPDGDDGLPFAGAQVVDPISSLVPAGEDVELLALVGQLSATVGKTCQELAESLPWTVLSKSLGVLPQSAFTSDRSLLVVTTGCLGGPGHSGEQEELICGAGYSESFPNASLVAGFMSRIPAADKVPLQFAHATVAAEQVTTLRLVPGVDASQLTVISQWSLGAVAPHPPYAYLSASDLGDTSVLQLYQAGMAEPLSESTFAEAFANSPLAPQDMSDGVGLIFVAVGAAPQAAPGPWHQDFTFTVVRSDP